MDKFGEWPFEIGLWVGRAATPNRMGKKGDNDPNTARARTRAFWDSDKKPSPIPIEECPWCGTKFSRNSFRLTPNQDNPTDLLDEMYIRPQMLIRRKFLVANSRGGRTDLPANPMFHDCNRRQVCFSTLDGRSRDVSLDGWSATTKKQASTGRAIRCPAPNFPMGDYCRRT